MDTPQSTVPVSGPKVSSCRPTPYTPRPVAMRISVRRDNFSRFLWRAGIDRSIDGDVHAKDYLKREHDKARKTYQKHRKQQHREQLQSTSHVAHGEQQFVGTEGSPLDSSSSSAPADSDQPRSEDHQAKMPLKPFEYSPLPHTDSIRTLVLEAGGPSDRLVFRIELARLAQAPQSYTALSYVWGDVTDTVDIFSANGTLRVTSNLCDALRRLRLPDKPRRIWADALCINQADDTERNHQVRLMGKIYSSAKLVTIWLGRDDAGYALPAFCALSGTASGGEIDGRPVGPAYFFGRSTLYTGWKPLSPADPEACEAVAALFSRPWFWRIWCIQEVALASSAVVLWGDFEISWSWLGLAAARIRFNYYSTLVRYEMTGAFNAYLMYRISSGSGIHTEPHKPSFFQLLNMTRQFESTDPRDRIYGLLGLPTTDSDPANGRPFMDPDYTLSSEAVYRRLAQKVLQSGNLMGLLSCVQHGPEISSTSFPTWIPQWDKCYTTTIHTSFATEINPPSTLPRQDSPIAASADSILLKGKKVSTIRSSSPTISSSTERLLAVPDADQSAKLLSLLRSYETQIMLSFTLTAGKSWHGGSVGAREEHLGDFFAFIQKQEPGALDDLPNHPAGGDADRYREAARAASIGKRYIFDDGDRLGLGPEPARSGDWVCVLEGGNVPFVLRPRDDHFLLVGECYVHDYVGGYDGNNQLAWSKAAERSFKIR